MSTTLRFSPAAFLGMPAFAFLFGKPAARRPQRAIARAAQPIERATKTGALPKPAGTYPGAGADETAGPVDMTKLLRAVKVAPDLALLEWDGDRSRAAPLADADKPACNAELDDEDPHSFEPRRRKIRDRYIGTRFPGVARGSSDLQNVPAVVKSARLMFEEEQAELALELLHLAIEEAPQESALWLARLEILFLARDSAGFVAAARAFHNVHPFSDSWGEVERLGRALAPGEALFGATSGPRDHEHYGPWPHLPNWIQAPWDLTAEIVAADFHRAVTRMTARLASTSQSGD